LRSLRPREQPEHPASDRVKGARAILQGDHGTTAERSPAGRRAPVPTDLHRVTSLQDYQAAADLRAAIRLFQRRTEDVARRHGLTPQRHALLLMIKGASDGSERSTVPALAERLQLAQRTVTELVGRAERVGLIRREADDDDARVSHLRLTPEAARRLAATSAVLSRERERLEELLTRLGTERSSEAADVERRAPGDGDRQGRAKGEPRVPRPNPLHLAR
jgi:DNA-binding MarR family transcriptional regulator